MAIREGHENTILCPDWKERVLRSKLEELFLEYCEMCNWEILWYWETSYEIIEDVFQTQEKDEKLEKILYDSEVFFDISKMRKPQHAWYTPDFLIVIDGKKYIVEVKAYWKNSDIEWVSKKDAEFNIAYQLRKTLFLSKYKCNFLEVSTDKWGKNLTCSYYYSRGEGKIDIT